MNSIYNFSTINNLIILLYCNIVLFCVYLIIGVGSIKSLWYGHIVMIVYLSVLLFTNYLRIIIKKIIYNHVNYYIFFLLVYLFYKVFNCYDYDTKEYFVKAISAEVIPGIIIGILLKDDSVYNGIIFGKISYIINKKITLLLITMFTINLLIIKLTYPFINKLTYIVLFDEINYQSVCRYLVLLSMSCFMILEKNRLKKIDKVICILFILTSVFYCALLGGNKDVLAVILMLVFYIKEKVKIITKVIIIVICLMFIILIENKFINLIPIRIFNYSRNVSIEEIYKHESIISRMELIQNYGIDQIMVSPLFGDLSSDRIVTGRKGDYLHSSILSIQTHLGIIGTILFLLFIITRIREIAKEKVYKIENQIAFILLFVTIISTFFTNSFFWYSIGLLIKTDDKNKIVENYYVTKYVNKKAIKSDQKSIKIKLKAM